MTVSVFTPTYNRGYIIKNLFDSLCRQTCRDFEWVVVDDGSTDNTGELFDLFKKEANGFDIIYKKVPNGGKMRAVNIGAGLARGEVFFNIDSDDYAADDAVEKICRCLDSIGHDKEKYAGICGHRTDRNGKIIGTSFKEEYRDFATYERDKNGLSGDQAEIFFTETLRKYPFPEFEGEKFVSEAPTWMNICFEENKVVRFFNEPLICCEYIADGYTHNAASLLKNNVRGFIYNAKLEVKIRKPGFKERMKLYHVPYISAKLSGWTDRQYREEMNIHFYEYFVVTVSHLFLTKVLRRKY